MFRGLDMRPSALQIGGCGVLLAITIALTGCSNPEPVGDGTEMTLPKIMSGVWVTGFEESSFFPGAATIPDRNDGRRYRLQLIVDSAWAHKMMSNQKPPGGYHAYAMTFLGRRTKYPTSIDCYGGRDYFFVPDVILSTRHLGEIAHPDVPVPRPGEYKPFTRSGEGGVIRELEDRALAHCGGSRSVSDGTR
jgi:hypothetical protein